MDDAPHHVEPVGRRQEMGLKIPVAADDPRPLEGFDVNGSLLEDVHIGFGQPFSIFEIDANDVDATLANASNP